MHQHESSSMANPIRVFIEESAPDQPRWVELTQGRTAPHRVRARDLQEAQTIRARHRADARRAGGDPDDIAVIVDVAVLIGPTSRDALTAFRATCGHTGRMDQLHFVGTRAGLLSLLDDIVQADVADGVTLTPLGGYNNVAEISSFLHGIGTASIS